MADRPSNADARPRSGDPGTPRWVKVSGIIALVVVLLFVIVMLTGGGPGGHGPSRHAPSGDAGGQASLFGAAGGAGAGSRAS